MGLNEAEYLALVERIQKAMVIEPFRPDVADVIVLIGTCQTLNREISRLRARENEWRAWMEKTLDAWANEVNRLLDRYNRVS